jgi:hypothetical protein
VRVRRTFLTDDPHSSHEEAAMIKREKEDYHLEGAIQIPSSIEFDSLADHLPTMSIESIDSNHFGNRAIVIKQFLSARECQEMISFIESHCRESVSSDDLVMVQANSKKAYRNNLRMLATSERISTIFLERLSHALGQVSEDVISCHETNSHQFLGQGFGMNGTWTLSSLNPCFRLCKYNPSGHFGPHYDSDYVLDPINHRSLKTFMIYLNSSGETETASESGGFVGGETNFCSSHNLFYDSERDIYCSPSSSIISSLAPKAGDCLVFDHQMLHEGAQVLSGQKYILRSDVMYVKGERDSNTMSEEEKRQERGIRMYYEGMRLEAAGDVDGGIALYRRAFKLCPELEERT